MNEETLKKVKGLISENKEFKKKNSFLMHLLSSKDPNMIKVLENLLKMIDEIMTKEFRKDINVTVKNPVKDIVVAKILENVMIKNFPESFEISNLKEIKPKDFKFPKSFVIKSQRLIEIREQIKGLVDNIGGLLKVIEKQDNQKDIFISNKEPDEAIPVVLTTADRKSLYNVMMNVLGGVGINEAKLDNIISNTDKKKTLSIYNIVLVNADTEYSQALPAGTKAFKIYAVNSAKTAPHRAVLKYMMSGPNGNDWSALSFIPIPALGWDGDEDLNLSGKTLYFQSPTGGNAVVIIKAWT